ncbi:MAG: hypothetical protein LRS49_06135 [Desulfurococcales archaeon]|nr:hypothetical protein [Desulfurococcales archaeon]
MWEGEARAAVEAAERAAQLLAPGPAIVRRGPRGVEVEVPVMYEGVAVDSIRLDPATCRAMPKGMPHPPGGPSGAACGEREAREEAARVIEGLRVLGAAEYRGPEGAWMVPLAWGHMIVVHLRLRVRRGTVEVLHDPRLTAEVLRRLG